VVIQKSSHEVSHLIRSVARLLKKQQPARKPAASVSGKIEKRRTKS